MRSAPGLPMASTAPSSRRPTVGAMLLGSRSPRCRAGAAVELVLAEAVVQPQPGAGHGRAGPVAVRRGDRAGACRPLSTTETCAVLGEPAPRSSRPRCEQVQRRGGRGRRPRPGGRAGRPAPAAARRPGAPRRPRSTAPVGPVAEQRQHRREHRTADATGGGLVRRSQAPAADRQRGAHDRAVGREVGAPSPARREPPCRPTTAAPAHRRTTCGALARRSAGRCRASPSMHHLVAGADPAAVGPVQSARRLRVPAEGAVPDVAAGSSPTPSPSGKPVRATSVGRERRPRATAAAPNRAWARSRAASAPGTAAVPSRRSWSRRRRSGAYLLRRHRLRGRTGRGRASRRSRRR